MIDYIYSAFLIFSACFGSLLMLFMYVFRDLPKSEDPRRRYVSCLRNNYWSRWYVFSLRCLLRSVDRNLLKEGVASGNRAKTLSYAFSHNSLNFMLCVSALYPIASIFLFWSLTGASANLSELEIIPQSENGFSRAMVLIIVVATFTSQYKSIQTALRGSQTLSFKWAVTAFCIPTFAAIISGFPSIFAFLVAGFCASLALFLGRFEKFKSSSGASGIFGIHIGISYVVFYPYFHSQVIIDWVIMAIVLVIYMRCLKTNFGGGVLLAALAIISLFIFLVRGWHVSSDINESQMAILIFLGVFPIINASMDFSSTGITRFILRNHQENFSPISLIVDVTFALGCLFLVGLLFLISVRIVGGSSSLVHLDIILANEQVAGSIMNNPSAYYWLYFSALTTLIPTVFHVGVCSFGLITIIPNRIRTYIAKLLSKGENGEVVFGTMGALLLSMCFTIVFSITLTSISLLLYWGQDVLANIGGWFLWLYSEIAKFL